MRAMMGIGACGVDVSDLEACAVMGDRRLVKRCQPWVEARLPDVRELRAPGEQGGQKRTPQGVVLQQQWLHAERQHDQTLG